MSQLITEQLVVLDQPMGPTKDDVIKALARLVADAGRSDNPEGLADDAFARESKSATGMPGGLAIPHCRSEHVTESTLAFARLSPPIDFGAKDSGADLVFMIAAPASGDQEHMKLLTKLARALVRPDFTSALRNAATASEVVALVSDVVQPEGAVDTASPASSASSAPSRPSEPETPAATPGAHAAPSPDPTGMTIVAVTACPTGIAHTYMAAEALAAAGKAAGVNVVVEPQGSVGAEPLDPAVIASARAAIFATDVGVRNKERFAGLPEIATGVKNGIHDADHLVAAAIAAANDPNAIKVSGTPSTATAGAGASGGAGIGSRLKTAVLTGVSYMIPFVAAGGLLIALGFLFGGYEVADAGPNEGQNVADYVLSNFSLWDLPSASLSPHALFDSAFFLYLGCALFKLGALAFAFLLPALAGYIAFGIADRPGIAPGFTVGAVCIFTGAGFLGALVGGILAGFVALWISQFKIPSWARGLMPVVVIPLFATLIAGGIMLMFLAKPFATLTTELQDALNSMSGTSAVVLGIILGLMMAFDMGGPVNKAAYAFATAGLSVTDSASLQIMAAVVLAGMVPPLALALACALRPHLFNREEQENGKAAWALGASFISEGAIPFAAADPFRVIPAIMLGAAVTGGLAMGAGVELAAPHGGIFVLFAVDGVLWFFISLIAGTIVGGIAVIVAKSIGTPADTEQEKESLSLA